jgi:hypothetical protein
VWPPSVGCDHDIIEVLEEARAVAEEEAGTAGAAEREATCDWMRSS